MNSQIIILCWKGSTKGSPMIPLLTFSPFGHQVRLRTHMTKQKEDATPAALVNCAISLHALRAIMYEKRGPGTIMVFADHESSLHPIVIPRHWIGEIKRDFPQITPYKRQRGLGLRSVHRKALLKALFKEL